MYEDMANEARCKHTIEQLLIDKKELRKLIGRENTDKIISLYDRKVKVIDPSFIPSTNKVGPPVKVEVSLEVVRALDSTEDKWTSDIIIDEERGDILTFGEVLREMRLAMNVETPEEWVKLALALTDVGALFYSSVTFQTVLLKQMKLFIDGAFKERSFRESMRDAGYGRNPNDRIESFYHEGERWEWFCKTIVAYEETRNLLLLGYDELRAEEEAIASDMRSEMFGYMDYY